MAAQISLNVDIQKIYNFFSEKIKLLKRKESMMYPNINTSYKN